MTLPSTGAISLNDINNEFGLGRNLAVYRGVTWYTDAGGSGTFPNTGINMGLFRGKRSTSPSFNATITTNQQELNLRTWAVNNGWDQSSTATITIDAGVYIWSNSTSTPALTINGSWPGGITLVNNGYIMGKGGAGGWGYSLGQPGAAGGPAISLGLSCSITNNSYIGGGGGGGGSQASNPAPGAGGGGGAGGGAGGGVQTNASGGGAGGAVGVKGSDADSSQYMSGGGGGGRIFGVNATGGAGTAAQGTYNSAAQAFIGYAAGKGGGAGGSGGAYVFAGVNMINYGGAGGANGDAGSNASSSISGGGPSAGGGGGWGASGGKGWWGTNPANHQPGGAGGKAISLNGYTATRTGTGTTYGAVS